MKKLLYVLFIMLSVVACKKPTPPSPGTDPNNGGGGGGGTTTQPTITLQDNTVPMFSGEGGQHDIIFTSTADWTVNIISSQDNWCTVEPKSGAAGNAKITVNVAPNNSSAERSASVIIKAGDTSKTVIVRQKGVAINLMQYSYYVDYAAETIAIEVMGSVDVTIEIPEDASWVTQNSTQDTSANIYYFDIAENEVESSRETTITFRNGESSATAYIYQNGMYPSISFSQRDYYLSPESQTIAVEVTSNVEFTIEIDEWATSWITQTSTRGTTTNTFYFNIAQNEETWTRGASINFSYGDNYWDYVYVEQRGTDPVIIRSPMEYYITSAGKSIVIEVAEYLNVAVEISPDASWITRNTTQQTASNVYCFDIAKNETYDMRYAEIIFTDTDRNYSERIKISQNAIEVLDIKSPTEYDLTKEGGEITIELESSIDFDVVVSNPWIRRVETPNTRAITSNSYTFDIAANINPTQREGTIVFKAKVGDFSQTVKISQQRGDTNIESPEDGGDYEWQN